MSTTESGGEDIRSSLVIEFIFITLIAVPFDSVDACASIFLQTKIPFQLATWMTCDWCPIKRTIQNVFRQQIIFLLQVPQESSEVLVFMICIFVSKTFNSVMLV